MAATEDSQKIVNSIETIQKELSTFDSELAKKERWLVFNKIDLIAEEQQQSKVDQIISKLDWQGSVYALSALTGKGTEVLSYNIMQRQEEIFDGNK